MPPKPAPHIATTNIPSSMSTNLNHLTRTLSTATGLDATLATVCYTSLFVHTQIPYLTGGFLRASSRIPTGSSSLKALYTAVEDHRIFSRLWGLFPLYTTIVEAWRKPHRDPIVKTLLYASLAAGTGFQVFENVALLIGKGVLRSERLKVRENWFWVVSCRFWLAQLGFEMLRLARVRQLRYREELGAENFSEEKEEGVWVESEQDGVAEKTQELMEVSTKQLIRTQSAELERRWWRQLYVTVASIPLAIHWSYDEGRSPISEAVFSACGMIAGVLELQDAWEESA